MAQYANALAEQMSHFSDNASAGDEGSNVLGTVPSGFSLLQSKVLIGFSLLLMIVLARAFGPRKQKLPPGVRPLPRLPGTNVARQNVCSRF